MRAEPPAVRSEHPGGDRGTNAGRGAWPVVAAGGVLAVALAGLVWLDFVATRRELLDLLRDQAASLSQTLAAAARSSEQAVGELESQIAERLLDNARLLGELDRHGLLDEAGLDAIVERQQIFRVAVYGPDGSVERAAAAGGRPRRGRGRGRGAGASLLDRLLGSDAAQEAATEVHRSRWGDARVAAGVRRSGGGAIVLNADASAVTALQRQTSLDRLLDDVVTGAGEIAYVVLSQDGGELAHGEPPPAPDPPTPGERELEASGRPLLEIAETIELGGDETALLRLGMRLDGVRKAERRMVLQLLLSLAVSLALSLLGVGALWLRRRYALLSDEHARAEAALRRRDRLAAMGELASSVAHEVRNPLNAIAMSVRRLRRELPETDPDAGELLGVLESETRRIDRIVQQFLSFARPPRLAPRPEDVGALLREAGAGARALAEARGVTLEVGEAAIGTASVDAAQLRQALDNLVRNAVEATAAGGRVILSGRRAGGEVQLDVADTGSGVAPEHLPRLFDLYFTTKAEGTGVGLAVTQQIATAHGGTIEVESRPGEGTRMRLRLPIQPPGGERD